MRFYSASLWFALSAFISIIIGFFVCIIIVLTESLHNHMAAGRVKNPFLADKNRTITFYKIFSKIYDSVNPNFYTENMRKLVVGLSDIKKTSLVLDVGCGTGYTTYSLLQMISAGQVIGVDLTLQQLERAKHKLRMEKSKLSLIRADADHLPFKKDMFDTIVSFGAIEYFPSPAKALKQMKIVARKGGKMIIAGPELCWFRKVHLNNFIYTPSKEELIKLLVQTELCEVKSTLIGINTVFLSGRYVVVVVGTKCILN
jgi:ubiquinone/menaquinone biosynthesis C-methylase UbiE